ncbi:MAG: BF3164 family lipoprotein, partial [Bacteroidota bacterium]
INFIGMTFGISSTKDYVLIRDLTQDPFVAVYDKNTLDFVGKMIPNGKGPGESLNPGKVLPIEGTNTFWLFDGMMQRFQLFDIEAALAAQRRNILYQPTREFILVDTLRGSNDPDIINDSLFVTPSLVFSDCRFFYFDQQPRLISKVGKLPESKSNWPKQSAEAHFSIAATYYQAKLATHPKKDWVAVTYFNTDILEIYKGRKLIRKISGPEGIEIEKALTEESQGIYLALNTEDTRSTYLRVHGTEAYIFTQYQGKHKDRANVIYVYDWEGRPVQALTLNQDFTTFWVEETGSGAYIVYVSLSETGVITRFSLEIE